MDLVQAELVKEFLIVIGGVNMPNAPTPPTAKPVTPAAAKPVPPPVAAKPATPPAGYAANPLGTTPPEPAGAERFRAMSYPNNQPTTGASSAGPQVTTSITSLDARLTELEAVVHAIAPYSRNAAHPGVSNWVSKIGQRIKSLVVSK